MRAKVDLTFHWVDVFATEALGGNPLPVVLDADALDDATMKLISREFNQAETTFVLRPSRKGATCRLRSFTAPGHEIFGAGHNALGAWLVLAAAGYAPDLRRDGFRCSRTRGSARPRCGR